MHFLHFPSVLYCSQPKNMVYNILQRIQLKAIILIVCVLGCSFVAHSQSNGPSLLDMSPVSEEIDTVYIDEEEAPSDTTTSFVQRSKRSDKALKGFVLDFGNTILRTKFNNTTTFANGYTISGGFDRSWQLNKNNKRNRLFFSAGLEIRNFNCTFLNDDASGIYRDKYHFWYAGLPLSIKYVNTRHIFGIYNENDINFYFQAGITPSLKAMVAVAKNTDGAYGEINNTDYNPLLLQPFVSAGMSYTTSKVILLLGPYYSGGVNNISKIAGVSQSLSCYGIRLQVMKL